MKVNSRAATLPAELPVSDIKSERSAGTGGIRPLSAKAPERNLFAREIVRNGKNSIQVEFLATCRLAPSNFVRDVKAGIHALLGVGYTNFQGRLEIDFGGTPGAMAVATPDAVYDVFNGNQYFDLQAAAAKRVGGINAFPSMIAANVRANNRALAADGTTLGPMVSVTRAQYGYLSNTGKIGDYLGKITFNRSTYSEFMMSPRLLKHVAFHEMAHIIGLARESGRTYPLEYATFSFNPKRTGYLAGRAQPGYLSIDNGKTGFGIFPTGEPELDPKHSPGTLSSGLDEFVSWRDVMTISAIGYPLTKAAYDRAIGGKNYNI